MDKSTEHQLVAMLWWLIANTSSGDTPVWFVVFLRVLSGLYFVLSMVYVLSGA